MPKIGEGRKFTPIYNIGEAKILYKYMYGVSIYRLWDNSLAYTLWPSYVERSHDRLVLGDPSNRISKHHARPKA